MVQQSAYRFNFRLTKPQNHYPGRTVHTTRTNLVAAALQKHDGVGRRGLVGLEGLCQPLPVLGEEGEGDPERMVSHGEVAVSRVGNAPRGSHLGLRADVTGKGG